MSEYPYYVYIARAFYSDMTKIGCSMNLDLRIQALRSRENPTGGHFRGLDIVCTVQCRSKRVARDLERELHDLFEHWRVSRAQNESEWFWLGDSAIAAIKRMFQLYEWIAETQEETEEHNAA